MVAPLFVLAGAADAGTQRTLIAAFGKAGREAVPVAWNAEAYTLQLRDGAGIALHLEGASLDGAWLVSATADLDPRGMADLIDYCRYHRMRSAFAVPDQAIYEDTIQPLALADLLLATSREASDKLTTCLVDTLRLPPSELPQITVVGAAADEAARAAATLTAIDTSTALRRVWCYVEGTVRTPYNSGVQRLARALCAGLQDEGVELACLRWDADDEALKPITAGEAAHLARWNGPAPRAGPPPQPSPGDWLIVPEITLPPGPAAERVIAVGHAMGFRVAYIFFDLIPLKLSPRWPNARATPIYDTGVASSYEIFWKQLAYADAVLPISLAAGADLAEWLRRSVFKQNGFAERTVPIQLGGEFPGRARIAGPPPPTGDVFRILSVGTVEPRKNHKRLIRAFRVAAAQPGAPSMRLVIAGSHIPHPDYAKEVRAEAERGGKGEIVFIEGADDAKLSELYADADLTAYASYEEGFGLPILESAWFGVPCLCHNDGAILETAREGGAHMVDMLDEAAIAAAIVQLAGDRGLMAQLTDSARSRPIKTWRAYARDVVDVLARLGPHGRAAARALPALQPAPIAKLKRPLLSICVSTYNRAGWLAHTLPRILRLARPYRDVVEVVVCDNASSDETPDVVRRLGETERIVSIRNAKNVGMLGNLGETVRHATGEYVWLLGDDDILVDGVIEDVLEGLLDHPDVEMAYVNYAITGFDNPKQVGDGDAVIAAATAVAAGGPNRRVAALRDVATLNENLFTAIYTCIFRRNHAVRAYTADHRGLPFSSLAACVPSARYVMEMMLDLPAFWIGRPGLVVNTNVSWREWALLWHLERMPELFDVAERRGLGGARIDYYRWTHAADATSHIRDIYFTADAAVRERFDIERFIARALYLDDFRNTQLPKIRQVYKEAAAAGRLRPEDPPPARLFASFGLAG